jgi:hypothetical protein
MDNQTAVASRLLVGRTLKRLLDRRLLVATINLSYRPALSHVRNAIPTRAQVYELLYQEALAYARAHADIWGVSVAELHARIPALEHLRFLAGEEMTGNSLCTCLRNWAECLRTRLTNTSTKEANNGSTTHKEYSK